MNKSIIWTALAVLAIALSFGGAQEIKVLRDVRKPFLKPDLTAVSIDFQVISQTSSTIKFKIAAKVKNLGPGSSPACELDFLKGLDPYVAMPFQTKPVPTLAANAEATVLSDELTHAIGAQSLYYRFDIDLKKAVAETNEGNNNLPPAGWKKFPS